MDTKTEALIGALYRVPEDGKAEIVDGALAVMEPTGAIPSRTGGDIYSRLRDYERRTGLGYAFPDNAGFIVNLPHRKSFSPDAAFFIGELQGGKFLDGAPVFAAEVRTKAIMALRQSGKWQPNARTILRRVLRWYGMWMRYKKRSSAFTGPVRPTIPRFIASERLPKRNPPCPDGPCLLQIFFHEILQINS